MMTHSKTLCVVWCLEILRILVAMRERCQAQDKNVSIAFRRRKKKIRKNFEIYRTN